MCSLIPVVQQLQNLIFHLFRGPIYWEVFSQGIRSQRDFAGLWFLFFGHDCQHGFLRQLSFLTEFFKPLGLRQGRGTLDEKRNGAMKHRSAKEGYSNQIPRDGRRTGAAGTEDEESGHDEHGCIPAEDGAGRLHSAARSAGVKRDAFPASLHGQQCQPDC